MDKNLISEYRQKISDELYGAVLPFWANYGTDPAHGGVRTCLDRQGNAFSAEKSVWMQGRGGWMFAHVYKHFDKDEKWLDFAKSCIDFARNCCVDPADGRMYFTVADDGTPFRKRRYVFSEYFYIIANAEYYGASKDEFYLEEARRYYKFVKDVYADPSKDPYKITPKFLPGTPPMRGLATELVLLLLARVMRNNDPQFTEEYTKDAAEHVNNIVNLHYIEQFGTLLEAVTPDGKYDGTLSSGRTVNPGHCLETAWTLLDEADEFDNKELIAKIEKIYEGAFKYGWDEKYGGLLYFVDVEGKPPQAYEHDMKLWWVHTEALIAAIKLYRVTGKEKYFQDFQKLYDYAFGHFCDKEYGEWYGYLRRDGEPTEPICKGNVFKGPFHVPRMYCELLKELTKLEEMA